jgi:PncC family amidohydrolase
MEDNGEAVAGAEETAKGLLQKLKSLSLKLALVESCTAGLVSNLLADIPGASSVLWGSFVCYTAQAKISMLGIDGELLKKYGLVSCETARAMAEGALEKSGAGLAASVTGLAGPDGDDSTVPVGTVWIAVAMRGKETFAKKFLFSGTRNEVRLCAAKNVLESVQTLLT